MEEGERKDEASPALVFFGNRSHTFSLRCKPKVHAELQTQKCSPEKFLIDNYNSGTGTYLLHLPTWLHTDEKLSEKSYFSEGVPNTRRDFLIETSRLVFCTSNSQTFSIIKESVGYWKTVVFSQFFFPVLPGLPKIQSVQPNATWTKIEFSRAQQMFCFGTPPFTLLTEILLFQDGNLVQNVTFANTQPVGDAKILHDLVPFTNYSLSLRQRPIKRLLWSQKAFASFSTAMTCKHNFYYTLFFIIVSGIFLSPLTSSRPSVGL